jgi:hypothetical protein
MSTTDDKWLVIEHVHNGQPRQPLALLLNTSIMTLRKQSLRKRMISSQRHWDVDSDKVPLLIASTNDS